jgi:hypothetical protein
MMHFHPMMEGMERFARTVMPLVAQPRNAATGRSRMTA